MAQLYVYIYIPNLLNQYHPFFTLPVGLVMAQTVTTRGQRCTVLEQLKRDLLNQ